MPHIKPSKSNTRRGQIKPVEANISRLIPVQPHDKAVAPDKRILTKLTAILKAAKLGQSWIEDIEASVGYLHGRLANIEAGLSTLDHGIAGGYDFPRLSLKAVPNLILTQDCLRAHDLLARSYFVAPAECADTTPNYTYATWIGTGNFHAVTYFDYCKDHSEARDRALAKAEGLEYWTPAEILVVGPWQGDSKLARNGAIIAVRWSTSMYEIEDPFTTSQEDK